jgi:ubiquitin carboxyl-terminal hydrolase 8
MDKKFLTGFRNIGNTCYMNSVLQCLACVPDLVKYLLKNEFKDKLINNSVEFIKRKDLELNNNNLKIVFESSVTKQLYNLIYEIYNNPEESKIITPTSFKKIIGNYNDEFSDFRQNDSHELLNLILDKLQDETTSKEYYKLNTSKLTNSMRHILNLNIEIKKLLLIDDQQSKQTYLKLKDKYTELITKNEQDFWKLKGLIYWKDYYEKNVSFITDTFVGLYLSVIETENKKKHISFSPFTTLTLPIPNKNNCTLHDCLDEFSISEELNKENNNQYYCSKDNKYTDAKKQMYIWRSPKILVIHLARFTNNGMKISKNNTSIDYPLKDLTLESNVHLYNRYDKKYDLISVSIHMGGAGGGHYVAYRKFNNIWYSCNDSHVSVVDEKKVIDNNAYLLIYKEQE